ncbi:ankyrin repeat-containing domain protein [Cercophora newfieldiana]|uniref:Ankyrin repeat-containing domain protein n=1 Tax=Cercophora newfieldiana TaxID=92897 RepID=A0AA39XT51_9PEZI|nr:ankyrin repeat-containing domain protein [Cercophora newfieldiana]
MAEIGLAASIITVVQLTGQCLKLIRKRIGPSNFSSSDLSRISAGLYEFNGAVKNFQTHLEIYEDDEARLQSLQDIGSALHRCEAALRVIKEYAEHSGFLDKHLAGPKFDRKLKTSLKALDGAKELLTLALQRDHLTITRAVEQYIRIVAEDTRNLRNAFESGLDNIQNSNNAVQLEIKQLRADTTALRAQSISFSTRDMIDWITKLDYAPQQNDFINRRATGTGSWLLETAQFETWVNGEAQTLFCPGFLGTGKTIITSIVVDHLSDRFEDEMNVAIAYIYLDFRRQHEQEPASLLAALLRQLARRCSDFVTIMSRLFEKHDSGKTPLSCEEISQSLRTVSKACSRTFVIVDGLDECDDSRGQRSKFLREIFDCQAACGTNLFVTSRFIPEITSRFSQFPWVEVYARRNDVENYVGAHLDNLRSVVRSNIQLQNEIKTTIAEAVDGIFLLAHIYLDSLSDKFTVSGVRSAIRQFPKKNPMKSEAERLEALDQAYDEALERINGQKQALRELAKNALAWIVHAKRPLTTLELQHALSIDGVRSPSEFDFDNIPSVDDMVSVCAGLVTVDEESRIVRLIHHTTHEYLERDGRWFPNARNYILATCMTYLSFDIFRDKSVSPESGLQEHHESYPLLRYAGDHWGYYVENTSIDDTHSVIRFLGGPGGTVARYMLSERWLDDIHLAAYFGLDQVLTTLISQGSDPDLRDDRDQTPLSWAAERGNKTTVALLLTYKGVDPNSVDKYGCSPLTWAARYGHEHVVKVLLARPDMQPDRKDKRERSPLSWAAAEGHAPVAALLLRKIWHSFGQVYGCTPLHWAVAGRFQWMIELLVAGDFEVDWEARDAYGRTPLLVASHINSVEMIEACLRYGVDRAARDKSGRTAAHLAVSSLWGRDIIAAVAQSKASIDAKNNDGKTPLCLAAGADVERAAVEGTMQELLLRGADPNTRDNEGRTPISRARNFARVGILVEHGADINAADDQGRTPLMWAIREKKESAAAALLSHAGIDVKARDKKGRTALVFVAETGMLGIGRALLDLGTVADLGDNDGRTPLAWAAYWGRSEVVELLANRDDVDVDHRDKMGLTPLASTALEGQAAMARLLLGFGADPRLEDNDGYTPLSWAAYWGYLGVVELLAARKDVAVNSRDKTGRTPLSWAAEEGREEVVQLLLRFGADASMQDNGGRTPRSWALENGHRGVVGILDGNDVGD